MCIIRIFVQQFGDWVPQYGFGAITVLWKYLLEMFSRKMNFVMEIGIHVAGYVKEGFGGQKVVSLRSLKIDLEAWGVLGCHVGGR